VKSLLRLIAVVALVVGAATPANADSGWVVDRFRADITIRPDGTLAIVESIDVDFSGLQKHGILRDIPIRYRYDETRDRRYRLNVNGVTDASGNGVPYQVSAGDAVTEIKIGDPGRTVSGRQGYRIAYTVAGALNAFPDHDELYWNVNGADWAVPTTAAVATVLTPAVGVLRQGRRFSGAAAADASASSPTSSDGMRRSRSWSRRVTRTRLASSLSKSRPATSFSAPSRRRETSSDANRSWERRVRVEITWPRPTKPPLGRYVSRSQ